MSDYIIIKTFCNNETIANSIVDKLLEEKLVAGTQVSKVHSKYFYNGVIEECDEFKIELRTKKCLHNKIANIINQITNYEVSEISYYEINGNKEFLDWIDNEVKS